MVEEEGGEEGEEEEEKEDAEAAAAAARALAAAARFKVKLVTGDLDKNVLNKAGFKRAFDVVTLGMTMTHRVKEGGGLGEWPNPNPNPGVATALPPLLSTHVGRIEHNRSMAFTLGLI